MSLSRNRRSSSVWPLLLSRIVSELGTIRFVQYLDILTDNVALTAHQHIQSLSLTIIPYIKYALIAIIVTPPNFLWQEWLEESFPTRVPADSSTISEKNGRKPPQQSTRFSKRSALIKFVLDQSLGAAVNTAAFIALASVWQDQSLGNVGKSLRDDFGGMLVAGWRFWPAVTLLNLVVVPWNWRPVVGNSAALGWGVFVALVNG